MDVWTQFGAELLIFYRLESLGGFMSFKGMLIRSWER